MAKVQKKQKFTDAYVKKLEEVFAMDGTVEEACYYANISRTSYYNWIKEKPELEEQFNRLRNKPVLKARQEVMKGLNCYSNAMDYLKRKKKTEFGDNIEIKSNLTLNFDGTFTATSKAERDSIEPEEV